jgi:hypothetical protein
VPVRGCSGAAASCPPRSSAASARGASIARTTRSDGVRVDTPSDAAARRRQAADAGACKQQARGACAAALSRFSVSERAAASPPRLHRRVLSARAHSVHKRGGRGASERVVMCCLTLSEPKPRGEPLPARQNRRSVLLRTPLLLALCCARSSRARASQHQPRSGRRALAVAPRVPACRRARACAAVAVA